MAQPAPPLSPVVANTSPAIAPVPTTGPVHGPWLPFGWTSLPEPPVRDFDPIQEASYHIHAKDLQHMKKETRSFGPWRNLIEAARANPAIAVARSLFTTGVGIVFTLFADPLAPITSPIQFFYGVFAYTVIFTVLAVFANLLIVFNALGGRWILKQFSSRLAGNNLSFVNWTAEPDMFSSTHVIQKAKEILGAPMAYAEDPDGRLELDPADNPIEGISKRIENRRKKYFSIDVAKTLLLFSAAVYERDNSFVEKASNFAPWAEKLLQMSEEKILTFCERWDVSFTAVTDCVSVGGAYAGVFYSRDPAKPWMCLVFKGTGPDSMNEWLIDTTLAQESASDYLWGTCHQGFYTTLFPANGTHLRVLPYRRIIDTLRALASMLQQTSLNPDQPVNLWVAGHSLGAGLASIFYARTLKVPPGRKIILRDAYVFGCPSVGGSDFLSGWESLLHDPVNDERAFWRIANNQDVVARVPPGLARNRNNRLSLQPTSLLNYGAMYHAFIGIHLQPNNYSSPYYGVSENTQPGTEVNVVEDVTTSAHLALEGEILPSRFWGLKRAWYHPVELLNTVASVVAPMFADHAPPSYWNSLQMVTGNPRHPGAHVHEPKVGAEGENENFPNHTRGGNLAAVQTTSAQATSDRQTSDASAFGFVA